MLTRITHDDRGQELVEYAIVFIVLMTLVLGVIEFGIIVFTQNSLSNAAREGARFAVVRDNQPYSVTPVNEQCPGANSIVVRVCERLPGVANQGAVSVSVARFTGPAVRVTVNYVYSPFFGLIDEFLPSGLTLGSQSTMRLE